MTTIAIAAHALSAGLVIGLVYASMPDLGILLGLAIVSHKGRPATPPPGGSDVATSPPRRCCSPRLALV